MAAGFAILVAVAAIYLALYLVIAQMAVRKNRSPVNWLLITLLLSPLISIILLWLLPPLGPPPGGFRGAGA